MKKFLFFVFCFFCLNPNILTQLLAEEAQHSQLIIKIPTRGRAERFFEALDQYYEKLSHEVSYHFIISCDIDDPIMNCQAVIDKLKSYPHLSFYFEKNRSKIEACNKNISSDLNFDVLLLGSDDMIPIQQGYDKIIVFLMNDYFPDTDGVLHFNDGIRGRELNTLCILGKKYYDRFEYIYQPDYLSFYCDNEFMEVSRILKKQVYIDSVIIEHRHFSVGKSPFDALYIRNEHYWDHDSALYRERSSINFGIK